MIKFDLKQDSENEAFCDKNVYFLTKGPKDRDQLSSQFRDIGMRPNILDITNIDALPDKKTLLLVKKDLVPNLEENVLKEKLSKNHFVYTFSSYEHEEALSHTEGHITLPLHNDDISQMLNICYMKSSYQSKIKVLNTSLTNLEKISSLGQYTGSLVHDLNNYNTICMTALDGLKLINKKKYQDEKFEFLVDKGLKGSRMINSLSLKYRKFLYSEDQSEIGYIGLKKVVAEAVDYLEKDIRKFNVTVKVEIPIDLFILASEVSFIQVLMNLLKNSIYEVRQLPEKWISVKIKESNSQLSLIIVDSGLGIKKEVQSRMFDPLFTTKPKSQGTGFGLNFCRSELTEMGLGLSYIESKHTVFSIDIPSKKYKTTMIS